MVHPNPTLSFTIPSIYDDTPLDCRLYRATSSKNASKVAILAHPYAPLGGSYDDFVVTSITETLLNVDDWIVFTFNFRGAAQSKGKTSWGGKPEVEDFSSVAGLACFFLERLQELQDGSISSLESTSRPEPRLLLGGYSYGSLILQHLPPVPEILCRFEAAEQGTAATEIQLRAAHLAAELQRLVQAQSDFDPRSRTTPKRNRSSGANLSVTLGGEETPSPDRRQSRETHRVSLDAIPGKIRDLSNRRKMKNRSTSDSGHSQPSKAHVPQVSYLLISPLLPPLSMALAMSLRSSRSGSKDAEPEPLASHPTLILFGDHDSFTSTSRLVKHLEELRAKPTANLRFLQVPNAGHFWHEPGVIVTLTTEVKSWVSSA